jgi:NAD(P)-dependent dehydrogenase (short-subunit alcohol dehydrogenase family)
VIVGAVVMPSMVRPSPSLIALITGANGGIGRSAALHLARDGADLIITYRSHAEVADTVVGEIAELSRKAVALPLDVGVQHPLLTAPP